NNPDSTASFQLMVNNNAASPYPPVDQPTTIYMCAGGTVCDTGPGNIVMFSVAYTPDQSSELGPCTQCEAVAGEPINVNSGSIWVQHQDYRLPGLGGGIEVARTWNGLWSSNQPPKHAGMFGSGWPSTYEER